jgi:uncharacterized protein (DUF362 family)
MRERRSSYGMKRREFLAASTVLPFATTGLLAVEPVVATAGQVHDEDVLGVPGPYPGRVVEVKNKALEREGNASRATVRATLNRGLVELTGAPDPVEAWRRFVRPGEAVGIKVVPNGFPGAHTAPTLVLEVIDGLQSAGIKLKDMVVFDRYAREFVQAGYQKILPDGVAWGGLTPEWDENQLQIQFDGNDPIMGYDRDEFVQLTLVGRGQDPKDDRCFRSHLGRIVTKRLDKIICLPCLKDHHAAGVTGALKNMSHGLVNNVFRSHSSGDSVAMVAFIPAVVSHPIIRKKCVLHIMDGITGVWDGGPYSRDPQWRFDHKALLFATDPVAMDHVEWTILDAQRKAKGQVGLAGVGCVGSNVFQHEFVDMRQPQYIAVAGQVGLGHFDFKSPKGRRFSVEHRVVELS